MGRVVRQGSLSATRSRSRSRNFILSTTNQPKKIEELPGPPIAARSRGGCFFGWLNNEGVSVSVSTRTRSRSRNFILSTTNQPKKIEELPGPSIEARQEREHERELAGGSGHGHGHGHGHDNFFYLSEE